MTFPSPRRFVHANVRVSRFVAGACAVLALAACAFVLRPIGPDAFAGSANAVTFEDRAGVTLGTVLARDSEHAVHVPLERISPQFTRAIVAVEDARFAVHDGVDAPALARAAWQLVRARGVVSGGSTITMQLARLRWDLPRTPLGKAREIVLARRIELGTPKRAILEAYVNRLPMGGDLVGVEAGAQAYFGVPASQLDLAQAALLAALPNAPDALDPYAHRDALEARRRAVLARMVAVGAASAADAAHAAAERVNVLPRRDGIGAAPQLLLRLAGGVPRDATHVRTTLDASLQAYAETATTQVVDALRDRGVHDAAALVIDNRDGAILAYVGSTDYFARRGAGKNDGVVALRQPGSTLKPFLYELAFERRIARPTTILADVPTTYAIPEMRSYSPGDYSERFAGPVRARIALADSLNVPAVRVLSDVGVGAFLERLRALGFTHLTADADHYGLGLALGDGEVTLEELASAYATLANGGLPVRAHAFARDGDDAAPQRSDARIGLEPDWALVTDMLADPHARARAFGVASLLRTPFPTAVKTGTSSDFRDTWTVGFTRDVTVATWVGNFDGSAMQRVSGVTGAAPLWNRIVRYAVQRGTPPAPFPPPRAYVHRPMCATTGVRPTRACDAVVDELLDAGDLAAWARPPRPLDRRYDAWLAAQPPAHDGALRIVAPHDGDTFVAARGAAIAVIARGGVRPVWDLNGRRLPTRAARWTQPLSRGRWTLRAVDGARFDAVTFTVGDPLPHAPRAGFTIGG